MFAGREDAERLVVSQAEYAGSVHGAVGFGCTSCHQNADFPHAPDMTVGSCGTCHGQVQQVYDNSLHGYAVARGNPRAPTCQSCHGSHNVLSSSNPRSQTHKVRLPNTCAECHGTAGLLTDRLVKLPQSFATYAQSVHGQGTARGVAAAASCADCHSVHELRGAADPESRINKRNVASTCGQCHPDIQLEYDESIHGRALQVGVHDSPTCTDCHGEHLILSPRDPGARTYAAREATETCGSCHDDPLIIAKFNLQGGVVGSYVDSYHGWVSRGDYALAATCDDCHTAHSVLPRSDPASSIHPANLVATCARCHERADQSFAASYTHQTTALSTNPLNQLIRSVYVVAILGIIGLMVLHNMVIMNYFLMERRKAEAGAKVVLRFDTLQVIQHLGLTISFIGLVITGFALRFPDAWWAHYLAVVGMTEPVRSNLHRILAVILIATSLGHGYYVFFVKRGRSEIRAMLPGLQDVRDLWQNLKYYTWRTDAHARFGRYDYTQKAEYWALIWGTLVMILTGFVLWFPEEAAAWFGSWIVMASQTVHYYEAWLATLAIVVWHFFFVILHPEEYPMSWTWLTGKMSERAVQRHHGRWYDEEFARTGGPQDAGRSSRGEE
jgi:formate dehydrogenase gamma subunit